jgi:hypothetical protein
MKYVMFLLLFVEKLDFSKRMNLWWQNKDYWINKLLLFSLENMVSNGEIVKCLLLILK